MYGSHLSIAGGMHNALIEAQPVPANQFTPIGNSGFSAAQIPITVGSHTLFSPRPTGIYIYGFARADSYGYPGGLALRSME